MVGVLGFLKLIEVLAIGFDYILGFVSDFTSTLMGDFG